MMITMRIPNPAAFATAKATAIAAVRRPAAGQEAPAAPPAAQAEPAPLDQPATAPA